MRNKRLSYLRIHIQVRQTMNNAKPINTNKQMMKLKSALEALSVTSADCTIMDVGTLNKLVSLTFGTTVTSSSPPIMLSMDTFWILPTNVSCVLTTGVPRISKNGVLYTTTDKRNFSYSLLRTLEQLFQLNQTTNYLRFIHVIHICVSNAIDYLLDQITIQIIRIISQSRTNNPKT